MRLHLLAAFACSAMGVACGGVSESGLNGSTTTASGGANGSGGNLASGGSPFAGGAPVGGAMGEGGAAANGGAPANVSCSTNADCAPYSMVCEAVLSRKCVECLTSGDCDAGAVCRAGTCETPLPCSTSTDCASAPGGRVVCNPSSNECVQCTSSDHCGPSGVCTANKCVGGTPGTGGGSGSGGSGGFGGFGSGGTFGSGGVFGAGGELGVGGSNPNGGWPNVPEGAWARCESSADCTGGRQCTKALQELIVSGRSGGCVKGCSVGNIVPCDPAPENATAICQSILVGMCSLGCKNGLCPDGMDCISNYCFWKNGG